MVAQTTDRLTRYGLAFRLGQSRSFLTCFFPVLTPLAEETVGIFPVPKAHRKIGDKHQKQQVKENQTSNVGGHPECADGLKCESGEQNGHPEPRVHPLQQQRPEDALVATPESEGLRQKIEAARRHERTSQNGDSDDIVGQPGDCLVDQGSHLIHGLCPAEP